VIALQAKQKVHFVGIGGFGMSAIARILLQRGFTVSGSDKKANAFTQQLADEGATIFIGNAPEHVGNVDCLVVSSAISSTDAEVNTAQARGIAVYKRADILASLMHGKTCIAIAGTHGKTTTTAMVTHILRECGYDPSYIVGGVMANTGDNAHHGTGDAFVIEADEYDNMFHGLRPQVAVVTSLEYDHPDFFKTPQDMTDSFAHFVGLLPADGQLIVEHEAHRQLHQASNAHITQYGFDLGGGDWFVKHPLYNNHAQMVVEMSNLKKRYLARLGVYGNHNAMNALAAVLVAHTQGIELQTAIDALASFKGTGRRFELRADVDKIAIIDDYAHHPTAIQTTIEAAYRLYRDREIWAVWQPHTFSRTQALLDDYAGAFYEAHQVLVTDIFASREAYSDSIHSRDVVLAIQKKCESLKHPPQVQYSGTLQNTVEMLKAQVKAPAVILIMSAGDAPEIGVSYLAWLQDNSA
jgi:UDP-N-acetylmuramate--alanine ligase